MVNLTTVAHGHHSADGDNLGVAHHGQHALEDGVGTEDAVHVGVDEIGIGGHVETRVDGVGLRTTVLLVDDGELVVLRIARAIKGLEGLGVDVFHVVEGHFLQLEVSDELLQRGVAAAVVDDDDLEERIVLHEERLDVVDDGLLLIEGGGHDGYAGRIGVVPYDMFGVAFLYLVILGEYALLGQQHEDDVGNDQRHGVEEDDVAVDI